MNVFSTCSRQLDLNYYCCIDSSLPLSVPLQLKVPILFPLTLPFKFLQEEKTSLVFLYDLKKEKKKKTIDAIQDDSLSLSLYSNLPKRYFRALLAKENGRHLNEKVRWAVPCTGSNKHCCFHLLLLLLPSLIAIVLSQTNKSKYFFPFLCL